jgi:hypothetical protein
MILALSALVLGGCISPWALQEKREKEAEEETWWCDYYNSCEEHDPYWW